MGEKIHTKADVDVSRGALGRIFPGEIRKGVSRIVSSKAVPNDLKMKFRSKFNHGFINRSCLRCAILKDYKARDMQFFLRNAQHKDFQDLENV